MINLAIAAALLLSAETPPAAQSYQAREQGKGHGVPAQQTAGATAAPAAPQAAPPPAKKAAKPHPSAYGNREKAGHMQQPAAPEAPAGGEQK